MTIRSQTRSIASRSDNGAAGVLLQARDLSLKTTDEAVQVVGFSLHVEPRELVLLTGPCRRSRSLLLRSLAGLQPPLKGSISIDGVSLYAYRRLFTPYIGYAAPQPALYDPLTVQETLDYEARLRAPRPGVSADRSQRVQEALAALDLADAADRRVRSLTRAERWRLTVAVELVSWPSVLLVDLPEQGLEPADEVHLTGLLKDLIRRGMTVVQSSEVGRSLQLADRVVVLAADGSLAWAGPAGEAQPYFQAVDPETPLGLNDLPLLPAPPTPEAGKSWAELFQASPAYARHVGDLLSDKPRDLLLQDRPLDRFRGPAKDKTPPPKVPQVSPAAKFFTLAGRGLRLLGRERLGLLMLLAPILVAGSDFLLSSPGMTDPVQGDPVRTPIVLGLLVFLAMLTAALLFTPEIAKEQRVIARERRTASLAVPYALSKVLIALLLAVYLGLVWAGVHFAATGLAGGLAGVISVWITLALVALAGGLLGLIASALTRSTPAAAVLAVILIVPQLVLSGALFSLPRMGAPAQAVSLVNPARYAFETLLTFSGYGHDVALDPCWQQPAEARAALTDQQKQACTCLGDNLFSKCRFPGVAKQFSFVIEQPMPAPPVADNSLDNMPVQPLLEQGETLQEYAQAVTQYTAKLELYQGRVSAFLEGQRQYLQDINTWQRARSLAIGSAEGIIALARDQYGQGFLVDPFQHWGIMIGLAIVLMVLLTVIAQRRGQTI